MSGATLVSERVSDIGVLTDLVGYNLRRAQLRMFADLKKSLEPMGLQPTTFSVLTVVNAEPGLSQVAVGNALDIQRANLVAVIDDLEGRGWVTREVSGVDRRQYALRLTTEGARLLKRAWLVVREHEERLLKKINPVSRRRLMIMLRDLMPADS